MGSPVKKARVTVSVVRITVFTETVWPPSSSSMTVRQSPEKSWSRVILLTRAPVDLSSPPA